MPRGSLRFLAVVSLLAVPFAACTSHDDGLPSFTLLAGPTPAPVAAGGSGTIEIAILPRNGYNTPVNFPSRTTDAAITLDALTNVTTLTSKINLTFHVASSATIGPHTFSVTGNSTDGQNDDVATYTVNVTPAGSFSLSTNSTSIDVVPGNSATIAVVISRNNFTDPVQLAVSSDAGVTATGLANSDGNGGTVTVTLPTTSTAGPYTVTVTGTSGSITRTTAFTVKPGAGVAVQGPATATIQAGTSITEQFHFVRYQQTGTIVVIPRASETGVGTPGASTDGDDLSLVLSAPSIATPGVYSISLAVSVLTGGGSTIINQLVTVTPAGSYAMSVQTAPLNITAGSNASDLVNVTRTNFTQPLTVNATAQTPGIHVTPASFTVSASAPSFSINVAADDSVVGTRIVTLTSVVPLNPDKVVTFAVVVAPKPTNTTFNFCAQSGGTPLFVAVQDGAATSPWTPVTSSSNAFAFNITSARGGIAYVTLQNGNYITNYFYGTQAELAARGTSLCVGSGATRTLTGTVTNIGTASQVFLGLGTQTAFATPANTTFGASTVEVATIDVAATSTDNAVPPNPLRMFLRRGVTATAALGALDFAGTESFVPATATLTATGSPGNPLLINYRLHTANNYLTTYGSEQGSGTTFPLYGLPTAQMQAGDLQYAQAQNNNDPNDVRIAGVFYNTVSNQTVAFGAALPMPTVTVLASTPYVRVHGVLPVQAPYNRYFEAFYQQNTRQAIIGMTAGYANGAASVNLDIPNFSGLAGWLDSYGLISGVVTQWYIDGAGWSTTGGLTFADFVAGATYQQAARRAVFTP